jgi:hypothetical protein
MAAVYRFRQFFAALAARLSDEERATVAAVLKPAEQRLFARMSRFDQRHCLDVYTTLRRAGCADPPLLQAALLHDCGKVADDGRPIPLLYYGLFVVLRRTLPGIYDLAARSGRALLWPFAVHAEHEQRSARMVAAAGGSPELVAILRDYAGRRETERTRVLGWADDQN